MGKHGQSESRPAVWPPQHGLLAKRSVTTCMLECNRSSGKKPTDDRRRTAHLGSLPNPEQLLCLPMVHSTSDSMPRSAALRAACLLLAHQVPEKMGRVKCWEMGWVKCWEMGWEMGC